MNPPPTPPPNPSSREESSDDSQFLKAYFASPLTWLAAYFALNLAAPFLGIPNRVTAIAGAGALTFAYVGVVVFFAVAVSRRKLSLPKVLIWGALALGAWLLLDNVLAPALTKPIVEIARQTRMRPQGWPLLQLIGLNTLTDIALMSLAVLAGNGAARMIRTPNMIGPICAVIALIDVWGVLFGGIVSQMMEKTPQIAAKAMTTGPQLGAASNSRFSIPLPDIGVGDYLFLGLLFGALFLLDLNWQSAIKWVIPLVAGALLAITLGLIPHLPGLLFIALGVAIPNLHTFQYTREEKFALLYAGVFVAFLTGALYFAFKSVLPEKPSTTKTQRTPRTTQ